MSLVKETVRGALWTITAGMGSRAIGLVGTLVLTHFIAPADYGEVAVAAVLVLTANQLSTVGLGQFIVSRPDAGRGAAFHATTYHVSLGALALALLYLAGGRLGPAFDAPTMARYLPGLLLAAGMDRVSFVPERILVRDLRFGTVSALRTGGDLAHTAVSVSLAVLGWGAAAIVAGNVARSAVRLVVALVAVERRDWLLPCRLTLRQTRELFSFGVPIAVAALSAFAARRWDNLLVSRFYGPGVTGMYNLAYNLADVPAIHVGEQIGDVLLPSFARLPQQRRPPALLRSLTLLSLIVFPLAVGLGAVAPTLVAVVFDARWQPMAPMLVLLSALSITRPVGWTIASYLQARQRPRALMWLELGKLLALLGLLASVGRVNTLWACAAVGIAYGGHAVAALLVVERVDGVRLRRSLGTLIPALGACVPMVVAVFVVRALAGGILGLALEIGAGAMGYVSSALWLSPASSRDLWARLSEALRK